MVFGIIMRIEDNKKRKQEMLDLNNKKSLVIIMVSIIAVFAFLSVWLKSSTIFLYSVNASELSAIRVRDGNSGEVFEITDKESIRYIVESIQGQAFKRDGVSLGLYRNMASSFILQ